ncbi:hypothetical protein HJ588_13060 [Flexivirga sp. ID2601S]|uniref:Class I SAM-dependent methyltransferase n=1 Tax=Flexivirga aerilata TaxID=1656889 RepID=A0A849AIC5_9MICO|nr:hypothetical protein [Flexivirga aerilata]NNG40195.1 hypothetical protein [Flexivirga aerilata]
MSVPNAAPTGGVPLLGGEMPDWTDPPAPLGVLGDHLRATAGEPGSVLLLGRTAAQLHPHFPGATVVVRGQRDAEALHAAGVDVRCGGLDRLPSDVRADLVLLLDPPGAVLTPDSDGWSHVELVEQAARHLTPDGRLVAFVPGALSARRETSPPVHRLDGDDAWWVGTDGYDDRAPALNELPWQPTHLVLTTDDEPVVVAALDVVSDPGGRALLRALTSTHPATSTAVDAGVLPALADGWLVSRGAAGPAAAPVWSRRLGGDPALDVPATAGRSLEAELLTALRLDRQFDLRRLVSSYAQWVGTLPADRRALAVPRRTLVADGTFTQLESPTPVSDHAPPVEVAVAHGMLDLAHATTAPGAAAGYPPELAADSLAHELGAMVGLPDQVWVDAQSLRLALALPDRHEPTRTRPDAAADRIAELRGALEERDAQLAAARADLGKQTRRVRALEHAIATEHGPRARRALFLMTAPTQRIVEAARARWQR